jgi:hypothetical protein
MKYKYIYILILFLLCSFVKSQDIEKVMIIGNNTGISEITLKDARDVFKGKKSFWKNKEQVIIVLPASKSKNADIIATEIFQTSVSGMQKYWLALVFQGRANPPVFVQNTREAIDYVSKNPGAIAVVYCKESDLSSSSIIKLK